MGVARLIETLHATTDGNKLHRVVGKLERSGPQDREQVVAAFLEYMRSGRLNHWRQLIMPSAIDLIEDGESQYADAFRAGLEDRPTAYWSVLGLAKSLGKGCYGELSAFALDGRNSTEARGHAIKVLAGLSNQTFTRGLPTDPGDWDVDRLPLSTVVRWREDGYPDGTGFDPPVVSPALAKPQTEIDKRAAKLEKKLRRYRAETQDPANPTDWLVPADPSDLEQVLSRWNLPRLYVEFITKFSPLYVTVHGRDCGQGIRLYGAGELVEAQHGYSYNPITATATTEWNRNHVVIATKAGDPYVLDLAAATGDDCPVLTALHGQGTWDFLESSPGFSSFLGRLARSSRSAPTE